MGTLGIVRKMKKNKKNKLSSHGQVRFGQVRNYGHMGRLGIVCWEEEKKKERAMDGEWFSVACRILKKSVAINSFEVSVYWFGKERNFVSKSTFHHL